MSVLRAGVAGAGVFGRHHAGKYASLPGVRLAAVYDHVFEHAAAVAAGHGAVAFNDYAAFLQAVEAVTIASPADTHADLAQATLEAGRHAYVEKPLSVFGGDARYLVDAAAERGLVLAVGHQERVCSRPWACSGRRSARPGSRRCGWARPARATATSPACST